VNHWFDPTAFSEPTQGFFGSAAKGVLKGPGVSVLDAGLGKYFSISERLRLRWQMTATNFFNHPNWSDPSVNISDAVQVGVISGASGTHSLDQPGARAFRMSIRVEW